MKFSRIGCLLAVGVTLIAMGAPVVPHAGESRAASVSTSSVVPLAAIDLGGLFGNENEPDENEPDEGGGGGQQTNQTSGTSLPVVLLLVVVAAIAGGWVAIRVRRLWLRLQGWGRDMRARF